MISIEGMDLDVDDWHGRSSCLFEPIVRYRDRIGQQVSDWRRAERRLKLGGSRIVSARALFQRKSTAHLPRRRRFMHHARIAVMPSVSRML